MWLLLIIGLFCFLLVIGKIFGKPPLQFALYGFVILGAALFVYVVITIISVIISGQ